MRKRGRVDSNHHELVQAARGIGASVLSLANLGNGAPDLLIGFRGKNYLVEVKTERGKMTADEMQFMVTWNGQNNIVRTCDQLLDLLTNERAEFVQSRETMELQF